MNSSSLRFSSIALTCAAAFFCAAGAAAQSVHKQVDAAGRTTYTDLPEAPPPAAATRRVRYGSMSWQQSGMVDASEAALRLNKAKRERLQGAVAMRSEQRGLDLSTVHYAYWQRQEKLRQKVEQAQRRSNDVQRVVALRTP